MRHSLIMAPEVLHELGGEAEAYATLAKTAGPFRCVGCGDVGHLGQGEPTSVVVLIVRDGARRTKRIQFAHPGCADSAIRVVRSVSASDRYRALPGAAWLRPADTDPPAVFVIARASPDLTSSRAPGSSFFGRLLDHGFSVLTDPDTRLPHVCGLTAWHTPGRLAIHDRHGEVVWDGPLPSSHAWTYAALRSKMLGFVVASGVQLSGPDQARALYTAITGGRAAGAAICLADPASTSGRRWPHPRRSPENQPQSRPPQGSQPYPSQPSGAREYSVGAA